MSTGVKKKASRPAKRPGLEPMTAGSRLKQMAPKRLDTLRIPGFAKLFFLALLAGTVCYFPALRGQFLFDDVTLPFLNPHAATLPLPAWFGVRPVVMLSYLLNYKLFGTEAVSYHLVSLLLHACCAALVFLIVNKVLVFMAIPERTRTLAAAFSGAVFLLHPLQTESVSYIAARSEPMSALFLLTALYIFVSRHDAGIRFPAALGVLGLFGLAVASKESAVVLPAVLLLTDYYWNPGFGLRGIKANWRLYIPLLLSTVFAAALVFRIAAQGGTVGFHLASSNAVDYLLTQFRAIFLYFRLFLLPFGQNADWGLPISHSPLDKGAIFYGLALALLTGLAVFYRKRYKLASYGFLLALIFLSPTSSIVPIADPMAERRMYLPLLGLLFVSCEFITRARFDYKTLNTVLALLCLAFGLVAIKRNFVWDSPEALWRDAIAKRPQNVRALMDLGVALINRNACAEASEYLRRAVVIRHDYQLLSDLAAAQSCRGDKDAALATYMDAAAIQETPQLWISVATIRFNRGEVSAALDALDRAQKKDPAFPNTYVARGNLFLAVRKFSDAEQQFRFVLNGDPDNAPARQGLMHAVVDAQR